MIRFSKSGFFYCLAFLPLLLTSCGKTSMDIIPDVFVDFTIDLLDPEFVNLAVINAADTIDQATNNWGYKSAGYDNNGIIVFSGPDDYYAFDRTCPYDFAETGSSIKVKLESGIYAVCPGCGTKYSLSTYGAPISGPGRYPLKNYKTSFDGERYIRVWNK